jgi:hypothetical protein
MNITGSCFCGDIRYEADLDGKLIGICHCRDCQILSGSAYRTSGTTSMESFRFTQGEPTYFEKTADTGSVRSMAFCGRCGSHLCSMPMDDSNGWGFVSVRIATSDQFEQLTPVAEIFCQSRVAWLEPIAGLVQFPRMPVTG